MNGDTGFRRICACFFSPCHNTEKAVRAIADRVSERLNLPISVFDFTGPNMREREMNFSEEDIVVIGTPVYAGRIPNKVLPYVQNSIHGNDSVCICAVTFGNRSFGDALGELAFLMKSNGMKVIGGAAVVSEHSFAAELATGRPDDKDMELLTEFADSMVRKVETADWSEPIIPGEVPPSKYYTPLREDGEPAKFLKAVPQTDPQRCISCGACREACPMGVIDTDPSITTGACIKCQACIKICPVGARSFDDEDFLSHRRYLLNNYRESVLCQLFF